MLQNTTGRGKKSPTFIAMQVEHFAGCKPQWGSHTEHKPLCCFHGELWQVKNDISRSLEQIGLYILPRDDHHAQLIAWTKTLGFAYHPYDTFFGTVQVFYSHTVFSRFSKIDRDAAIIVPASLEKSSRASNNNNYPMQPEGARLFCVLWFCRISK